MPYPKLKFHGKVPKGDFSNNQCQDSYNIIGYNMYAISDGATQGIYSEIWAEILVKSFDKLDIFSEDFSTGFEVWLNECQKGWSEKEQELRKKELPWFTLKKLSYGSYATFLGLVFDVAGNDGEEVNWKCIAVGDSCLFVVKDDELTYKFPVESSRDFSSRPELIDTKTSSVSNKLVSLRGKVNVGDCFYLMTDALAKWFLEKSESNQKPWNLLNEIDISSDFVKAIESFREQGELINDDVALITIEATE